MQEYSIEQFTQELSSSAAVPGGGGASALVGAVGISLGKMVGELTVGKKKYKDVEEEMKALMSEAEALRIRLLDCIEKDAEAFLPLSRAYRVPKEDPSREEILEKCLKDAAEAPFQIMLCCKEAIDLIAVFAEKGSRLVLSDAATGVLFAAAAMRGAAVNVKVNTKLMKDRAYAEKRNQKVNAMQETYISKAELIYDNLIKEVCDG